MILASAGWRLTPYHHSPATQAMIYKVQSFLDGQWTDDAALLGHGIDQSANCWDTEEEALAAMDVLNVDLLIKTWPQASPCLRVIAVDA